MLVEQVLDLLRRALALQLDHDAHPVAVALVAQVGDALDLLVAHEVRDLLDQRGLVHLVGQLRDDDLRPPPVPLLHRRARVHRDAAVALAIGVPDLLAVLPHQGDAGRGEVRPLHELQQVVERRLRVLDQQHRRVDDLLQVVRRDVRRHPHGDARGAVQQQVRQTRGQDHRLFVATVVVRLEVDRVLVDVGDQLFRDRRQPRLGVAHGRRRVAIDAAEVPLSVHERVAHGEVLREAHHRLVHGAVAVRVVATHDVAHDAGRLAVGRARPRAPIEHAPDDASLHRFQAVAHIRQRPRDDHAHGVIEVARAHLLLEVDGPDRARFFHAHPRQLRSGTVV